MTMRRVALVSGAASGIGNATVHLLAKQGWIVGALDLDMQAVTSATAGWGHAVIPVAADVTDPESLHDVTRTFMARADAQRLDLLVNCAGLLFTGRFEDHPPAHIDRLLSVNNLGLAHCCQAAFPWLLRSAQAGGRPCVVNLSSASAAVGIPTMAVYSASKFWVKGFTEALSVEWSRFGITVRDVMPPFVRTSMLDSSARQNPFVRTLGMSLTAQVVAAHVVKAAQGGPLHRLVSFQFKALVLVSRFLPDALVRAALGWISRRS